MQNQPTENLYDVLIIGAGPAGLTASIYASRYRLKNMVLGRIIGGEISLSVAIENYPGFTSIPGIELAEKMKTHAQSFGAHFLSDHITTIQKTSENLFEIDTDSGKKLFGRSIILAAGSERRKLNVAGEKEYLGRGVSYCATCDGMFFRNKIVAVVGGGDSALTSALLLSDIAAKTYLIYRKGKEEIKAEPIWVERFEEKISDGKAELITESNITEIKGDGKKVTQAILDKDTRVIDLDGIFIEIGSTPSKALTALLGLETDERGYVKINTRGETNVPGIYAAGDITTGSNHFEQIITAASEGAVAAASAYQQLKRAK